MKLIVGPEARDIIENEKKSFKGEILTPPEHFSDTRFCGLGSEREYRTLTRPIEIEGLSTFGKMPLKITLMPYCADREPSFILDGKEIPMTIETLRKGLMHCLGFEQDGVRIDIVEHISALIGVLRLKVDVCVDVENSLKTWFLRKIMRIVPSWPSFDECNGPFIEAIADQELQPIDSPIIMRSSSVIESVCMVFPHGGMIAYEPPSAGEAMKKILINRINYPHIPSVGDQKMKATVTPELFAYMTHARPPAFANKRYRGIKKRGEKMLPFFALNNQNVVLVGNDGIDNPKNRFIDEKGFNWEPFGHEMTDKMFPWVLLERSLGTHLVGTWTAYWVSHAQEIEFIRELYDRQDELIEDLIEEVPRQTRARRLRSSRPGSPSQPAISVSPIAKENSGG